MSHGTGSDDHGNVGLEGNGLASNFHGRGAVRFDRQDFAPAKLQDEAAGRVENRVGLAIAITINLGTFTACRGAPDIERSVDGCEY